MKKKILEILPIVLFLLIMFVFTQIMTSCGVVGIDEDYYSDESDHPGLGNTVDGEIYQHQRVSECKFKQ